MKNALFSFSKFLILMTSFLALNLHADELKNDDLNSEPLAQIKTLKDSPSLTIVREFMAEVRADLETYYVVSDRNLKLPAKHLCTVKTKAEVVRIITKSIMHTLKLYPDEELPVSEAIADLKSYLRAETYEMCTFSKVVKEEKYDHSLFYSQSGTFYLRLDFVAPVN